MFFFPAARKHASFLPIFHYDRAIKVIERSTENTTVNRVFLALLSIAFDALSIFLRKISLPEKEGGGRVYRERRKQHLGALEGTKVSLPEPVSRSLPLSQPPILLLEAIRCWRMRVEATSSG